MHRRHFGRRTLGFEPSTPALARWGEPHMDDAAAQGIEACRAIAAGREGLELLVLFGSRARGEARQGSDWDFGYLADERFDPLDLLLPLVTALGTDRIDLVDLRRAG